MYKLLGILIAPFAKFIIYDSWNHLVGTCLFIRRIFWKLLIVRQKSENN